MGRKTGIKVVLDDRVRAELETIVRAYTSAVGLVRRARAVLMIADGCSFAATARDLPMRETHIRKWVARFLEHGPAGLHDAPRSGRPPVFSPRSRDASGPSRLRTSRHLGTVAFAMGLS